jgi:hypothetical protein
MRSFKDGDNDWSQVFETHGSDRSMRIGWPVAGRVQVRARLVTESGEVGPWSEPVWVKQQEASCSGGIDWPFVLLALLWRPRRRLFVSSVS